MATTPYTLEPIAQLGATAAALVTAPTGQYLTTKKVTVTNTSASAVAVTFYKVQSGGSAGSTNLLVGALTIPPNTTNGGIKEIYELENKTLQPGDALYGFAATAGVINFDCSGILQTT